MPLQPSEVAEQVYKLYPAHRREGKRAAIKAIVNALTRIHDGEVNQKPMVWEDAYKFLLTKTKQYEESPAGNRGCFTPMPATFFNQSRYLDHELAWYRLSAQEEERARLHASEGMASNWRPM
jgi:hypothetical protein